MPLMRPLLIGLRYQLRMPRRGDWNVAASFTNDPILLGRGLDPVSHKESVV